MFQLLKKDPLPVLMDWKDDALQYLIRRDLVDEVVPSIETLWELPDAARLIEKQQPDGSWKYPGKTNIIDLSENYSLLETYRNLRVLVDMYGMSREHPALQKTAEYIFHCQTPEGDIRGIIGNQYMPYYHGAMLALLIEAGYVDDPRITTGLEWLLTMRQDDGGWIVPAQAVPSKKRTPEFWLAAPVAPERSRPHAHMATGMVLRAFAVHPAYCRRAEIILAGRCLISRFFKGDAYNDRKAPSYWLKFQFPFWWTSLLTALDTLLKLGFEKEDIDISRGLDWFVNHQDEDGLWPTGYGSGQKAEANRRWVGFAICRMIKQYSCII